MDLSIIILNYQSKLKLFNCLKSISSDYLSTRSYEIIVVDNNSGDDLGDLTLNYPAVKLIMSPKNLGMGGGNNLGIAVARGEFILVLNPDTVVKERAILTLLEYLRGHSDVGLVGPKTLSADGSLQQTCLRWPQFFLPFWRRTFLGSFFQAAQDNFTMQSFDHQSIAAVDWLMGSCLLFKREITLSAGQIFRPLFDERYFMYFEDTDLARQFRAKNLAVVYNPNALIIHDHARESAKYPWYLAIFLSSLARHHISSWLKYFWKWGFKNPSSYSKI
ncbi:MAG: glycosyltransferase family 2 protein [Patescibacteria group bacterium]